MERISSAGLRELRMIKRAILTEQGQFDQKQFGFRRIDAFPLPDSVADQAGQF